MIRKLLLGSLVSAVFLYLAVRGIDWSLLWDVLKRTQPGYVALAITGSLLGLWVRAYRWKFMLLPIRNIRTHRLFAATMIGFLANNVLPARVGEIVKAYVVGRQEQVSRTAAFATVVLERVTDLFALLAFLLVVLLVSTGPSWMQNGGIALLAFNIVFLTLLISAERHPAKARSFIARLTSRLPHRFAERADRATAAFIEGLASVSKLHLLLPIVLTSLAVWALAGTGFYFLLPAIGLDLPFAASLTLLVVVTLGGMIPSAPAYLGTTQYACVVALGFFGVDRTEALAYSLLYHAAQFFPVTLIGLFYLWRSHMRLGEMSRERTD